MYYAHKSAEELRARALEAPDQEVGAPVYPHDILKNAYDAVLQDGEVVAGKRIAEVLGNAFPCLIQFQNARRIQHGNDSHA